MASNPLHLFLPHSHNNFKAKLLHHHSLLVLLGIFIMAQSTISIFHTGNPNILGYASQISPSAIIELTNRQRQNAGLNLLKENKLLDAAAAAKAADMFARDYWAHNTPDGIEPWSFISNSGYSYLHAGENLARDFRDPASVVTAWMNSASHKDNLLSPKYQDIGIAVVDGRLNGVETTLVVQMFGTSQSALPSVTSENTSVVPRVFAQETRASALSSLQLSPFDVSRSISLAFAILIIITLAFDWLIVWRRNIIRLSGKTWAHLTYFLTLLAILILLKQGLVL